MLNALARKPLMHAMNVPKIARTDPEESPSGDPFDENAIPDEED
jgi:hypothetical protein